MNTLNTLYKLDDTTLEEQFCNFWHSVDEGDFKLVTKYGLCYNFKEYASECQGYKITSYMNNFLIRIFNLWPKYSGKEDYPIKVSSSAELDYNYCNNMFDKSTEYGKLRWELFEFIYDVCTARLKSSNY